MAFKSLELLAATKIPSNSAQKLDASFDCYLLLGCHTQIAKNLPMIKRFQKSKVQGPSKNSFPSSSIFLDHLEPQFVCSESWLKFLCCFLSSSTKRQWYLSPEPSRWGRAKIAVDASLPVPNGWTFTMDFCGWSLSLSKRCGLFEKSSAWTLVNHGTCTLSAGPTGIAQRRRSNRKVVPQNHSSLKFSAPKHIASGPKQQCVVNSRMKHPSNQSFGGHLPYPLVN